jgi:small conductance mechanosensitive channel
MEPESSDSGAMDYIKNNSDEVLEHVSEYSYLVGDSLVFIAIGMLCVFLLHKLASKLLYPYVSNGRLLGVIFGALYVLVLVVTILLVLKRVGLDVGAIGSIAILVVLVVASVLYFLIPFFPKLPFLPGHTIETNGVMGTVDTVSTFHTTLRKFDGTIAFLPNALVMATRILNYSYTPERRIELKLLISPDADLPLVKTRLLQLVEADERVLSQPAAPSAFVMSADAVAVEMTIFCWVKNEDFLGARSDLWLALMQACKDDTNITLSLPRQEVYVRQDPSD